MNRSQVRDVWGYPAVPRHVYVLSAEHRYARPCQGLAIDFKMTGKAWEALVTYVEETADGKTQRVVQAWVPIQQLLPVKSRADDLQSGEEPY